MKSSPVQPAPDKTIHTLRNLGPGEEIIYFVGWLDTERLVRPQGPDCKVADEAYRLMKEGKLHLTQRRISAPAAKGGFIDWKVGRGSGFKYIATGAIPKKERSLDFLKPDYRPMRTT